MSAAGRVVIVDDEPDMVENCTRILRRAGYRCSSTTDPRQALALVESERPDGRYESGADIADDEWITLKLDIADVRAGVSINGKEEFVLTDTKAAPEAGGIGLWVGRGTEGYLANLRMTPR